jgi:hypothetical protein
VEELDLIPQRANTKVPNLPFCYPETSGDRGIGWLVLTSAVYVDLGKLFLFKIDVIAELNAFPREIRLFGVGLRTDGDILMARTANIGCRKKAGAT